ncbi:MAG: hypothetical protein K0R87_1103 [Pseudonocardia sp.]|nr:hypothetical protein [Pseudonocardia sp.]
MDERDRDTRLTATFQDAAQDAPPAGFDVAEVLATSRRLTRRRRSALAGAALAVLALTGVGVTAELAGGSETVVASSAHSRNGADAAAEPDARDADRAAGLEAQAAPAPQAAPHGAAEGESPLGPGMRECADRQDPQLRALVEQVLPEVEGAPEAPRRGARSRAGGARRRPVRRTDRHLPTPRRVVRPGVRREERSDRVRGHRGRVVALRGGRRPSAVRGPAGPSYGVPGAPAVTRST